MKQTVLPGHRICLWSSPRNVSTAFMYSWAQRSDTQVVDEPLYGYYLTKAGQLHPGRAAIMQSMECDGAKVIQQMAFGPYSKPVVFFKHMSHHMLDLNLHWMEHMINIFFIRHPGYIIDSYTKVIGTPTMDDIGIAQQWKQHAFAQQNGFRTLVLDAAVLLEHPESVLKLLCSKSGIPYEAAMLQWKPGPRPEDGIWAQYWYQQVHQSTGFEPLKPKVFNIPPHLEPLYQEALTYYEKMKQFALTKDA